MSAGPEARAKDFLEKHKSQIVFLNNLWTATVSDESTPQAHEHQRAYFAMIKEIEEIAGGKKPDAKILRQGVPALEVNRSVLNEGRVASRETVENETDMEEFQQELRIHRSASEEGLTPASEKIIDLLPQIMQGALQKIGESGDKTLAMQVDLRALIKSIEQKPQQGMAY